MKILQVMAGGKHGGAETAFVDMCIAMHEAGEDVEVVTRPNPIRVPQLMDAGLKVHTLPFGGGVDVYTSWRLGKIIEEAKPDIVQTWMARAAKKTPSWSQTKTEKRYLNVARLGGYYKPKNFKTMDYFITITPDLKRHLVDGGIAADKIQPINNFAETEKDADPASREALDTPKDAPVLLTLSRLHVNKALDIVLEALAELPEAYLWMAGEGPDHGKLEQQAKDLGVIDRVRFLGWRTDRSALLQAADVCLFCSRVEPFGTVFAQAWANKTPVIVSDADGPRQFCRDGEDSLMVPKDDARAIMQAVQRLLADRTLQMQLVNNGYQRYQDEFTKEKCVSNYLEHYLSLLKREDII